MARQMKDSGIEWIGEIPETWESKKLKYVSSFIQNKYEESFGSLPYIGLENIVAWNGSYIKTNSQYDRDQSLLCEPDDILFGKLRPYLAKVYMNPALQCCSGEFAVIRIVEQHTRYMWYQMLSHGFIFTVDRSTYGTKMPRANVDFIKNIPVAVPPLAEQQRIAAFLDRKCAEIDAVIERTKATIEEYKKLKQAVITEAVTKGVRGPRPMKDSGTQWIGSIPADWMVYRIANLYDERSEEGAEELPILTVSINTGVSDHEVADEDKDRVFVRIEDRTKYKRVYPGDLTYNMMRAWQGAFGAVRVHGMVSPAYVIAKPKETVKLDSRYMEALFRTKQATEEMHRYSRGIVDFRLRLYWPEFKNIRVCLPSYEEQKEIADYIDEKSTSMDTLIAKKTALLTELETYKKSLIYEYVTGKKECPEAVEQATAAGEYPYFPAAVSTKKLRFAQAMMMAKVLDMHGKGMGRVKLEKMLYTIEISIGFDFDTEYVREAAGPLHESIYKCEGIISRQNHWYQLHQSQYGVSYTPTKDVGKYRAYYDKYFSSYNAEIERIINIFKPYSTDQAEIVATLFAAWNDAIIDRKSYTDEDIVDDVLNNWHDNKKRFPKDVWLRAMEQMRKNNLIPKGYGKHTVTKAAEM